MKRRTRTVALATLLSLLLAVPVGVYAYMGLIQPPDSPAPTGGAPQAVGAPRFLFSFNGNRLDPFVRPVGILADDSGVYVVDSSRHVVDVFDEDGEFRASFGASETAVPLYIARSPLDGNLYVSDRSQGRVLIFDDDGGFVGPFEPRTRSSDSTAGPTAIPWAPVALDFAPDGSLFVTDVLDVHRVLKFAPAGVLLASVGSTDTAGGPGSRPGAFQFPNGIAVHDGRVYVADSNNGRIQVFDQDLEFIEMTVTGGLPRGIDFLPTQATSRASYVLVDALSNDATIRGVDDDRIVQFAHRGDSRLSYPNGISVMAASTRIYIADTAAGQVQVWGWEGVDRAFPVPEFSWPMMAFLAMLPLLPLLLLARRQRVVATGDFIQAVIAAGGAGLLGKRKYRWLMLEGERTEVIQSNPELAPVLRQAAEEHAVSEAYEGQVVAAARRAGVLATENIALGERVRADGVDVIDAKQFLSRYEQGIVEHGPLG